jgi:hypothetical protein
MLPRYLTGEHTFADQALAQGNYFGRDDEEHLANVVALDAVCGALTFAICNHIE